MRYVSTRGHAPQLSFEDAVTAGLAADGGLYVPETLPRLAPHDLAALAGLSYVELAARLMRPFTEGALEDAELRKLLEASYTPFRHAAVAPLRQIGQEAWILELFHGPTLAFKDFALQFLGRLLAHLLAKRRRRVTVLGATSGDTGSAAIAGCRGLPGLDIVILYPHGRVSDVQRRQMTTWEDANVHCLAVEGDFDDCQRIVKTLFLDADLQKKTPLIAVNSINWARILAQIVYYFYAALALGAPGRKVAFSVPTGNFGDIYAGHLARRMGLPVETLVIASNRNDILTRCLETGVYAMREVAPSLSPSMDIQVSSNFERLLFELYAGDAGAVNALMETLRQNRSFALGKAEHRRFRREFAARAADDEATTATMREVYAATGEILDPHTAVGVHAARSIALPPDTPIVTLATAHPAKFPDAVEASIGLRPALPPHMAGLLAQKERFAVIPADPAEVKRCLERI